MGRRETRRRQGARRYRRLMALVSYAYQGSSALTPDSGLRLQTSGGVVERSIGVACPRFFTGFVTTPEVAATGLLSVAEVARTRYFQESEGTPALRSNCP
jgi:hypothetical protein